MRRRAWPALLGLRVLQEDASLDILDEEHQHRDQAVVAVDVERSLWALTSGTRERRLMGQVVPKVVLAGWQARGRLGLQPPGHVWWR